MRNEKSKNPAAVALGKLTSEKKAASSRLNGARGGRPVRWCVYVVYDGPYGSKGAVLSRHATYETAQKAERKYSGGFTTGIKEITK